MFVKIILLQVFKLYWIGSRLDFFRRMQIQDNSRQESHKNARPEKSARWWRVVVVDVVDGVVVDVYVVKRRN